jgi:hypothetical protein
MSALIEAADPDFRVHAAWLARVSEGADGALATQVPEQHVPKQDAIIVGDATISLNAADHLGGPDKPPRSRLGRRPGVIIIAWVGFAFAMALGVSVMSQHFGLSESWRQSRDRMIEMGSSEWLPSLTAATQQNEPGSPKLIVHSSPGVFGEPAPLGLTLQGVANDAVVIIKGLVPGMELSTGNWVAVDTWQLQARDLPYAWIAPPEGFMGSADLVAELRLPDS